MTRPHARPAIRTAEAADAPAIARLVAKALGDKYRPALGRSAESAIEALVRRDVSAPGAMRRSVDAWARRRGVASALLEACADQAHAAGRRRLTLWVTIDNAGGRALYEATGFAESRRRRWLVGRLLFRAPGAILMERRLAPARGRTARNPARRTP